MLSLVKLSQVFFYSFLAVIKNFFSIFLRWSVCSEKYIKNMGINFDDFHVNIKKLIFFFVPLKILTRGKPKSTDYASSYRSACAFLLILGYNAFICECFTIPGDVLILNNTRYSTYALKYPIFYVCFTVPDDVKNFYTWALFKSFFGQTFYEKNAKKKYSMVQIFLKETFTIWNSKNELLRILIGNS